MTNQNQKKKTPDTSDIVKQTDFSSKISKIENKIPSISGLARTSALSAVKEKIPNVSNLVKKKLTIAQKLIKLKKQLLITVMINILLLQILVS